MRLETLTRAALTIIWLSFTGLTFCGLFGTASTALATDAREKHV